jgi:hypothetical protein
MRGVFLAVLVIHGALHLLGFAKGVGLAELTQLTRPISKGAGFLWLVAALAMFATAAFYFRRSPSWWVLGLCAVALSQALVLSTWGDAKFGTVGNLLIVLVVAWGFAS